MRVGGTVILAVTGGAATGRCAGDKNMNAAVQTPAASSALRSEGSARVSVIRLHNVFEVPSFSIVVFVPSKRPAEVTVAPSLEPTVVRSPDVGGTTTHEKLDATEALVRFDATDVDRGSRALVSAGWDERRARDATRAVLRAVFAHAAFESDRV